MISYFYSRLVTLFVKKVGVIFKGFNLPKVQSVFISISVHSGKSKFQVKMPRGVYRPKIDISSFNSSFAS